MKFSRVLLAALATVAVGGGAAYWLTRQGTPEPQYLPTAVRLLSRDLRIQMVRHRKGLLASLRQEREDAAVAPADVTPIVVAPFVDANSGEVVNVSKGIEQQVEGWLVDSGMFGVRTLTPDSLVEAEYVLFGVMLLDDYHRKGMPVEKRYHIIVSAVDHKTHIVAAHAETWVAESDLDYTPAPLYRDSPMFPRDPRLSSMVAIARSAPGKQADRDYYDSLETNALMAEAENYFDLAQYPHARRLFKQVIDRKDGKVLRAYLGLYRADVEIRDMIAAELAFRDLVAVGASTGLNTKFLFRVNSTEFVANESLREQYDMWTHQIGRYFSTDARCIDVVGHTSRTGTDDYNQKLSLARAERIRDMIVSGFPAVRKKARATGKGATENIVGSASDDQRDALDRRVEVVVAACAKP